MGLSNYIPASSIARPGVCTSTTRPASPYEGQTIYETDTDMLAIWNGSAWRYIAATTPTNGTILQVVSKQVTTTFTTTSTTYVDATDLNVTITPKSSSSKVLITASVGTGHSIYTGGFLRLLRGSTVVGADPQVWFYTGNANSEYSGCQNSFTYLDSPASTSALTYKIQVRCENASGVAINRSWAGSAGQVMQSSLTAMEVAG